MVLYLGSNKRISRSNPELKKPFESSNLVWNKSGFNDEFLLFYFRQKGVTEIMAGTNRQFKVRIRCSDF